MALAYKVEELLALRSSASDSAVSLEKFGDEDVIKEHVLRPSASASMISGRSENIRPASNLKTSSPDVAADKKISPSPSVKRGKAERLLKEHGSPPGMRVTAGGRVVPSDLPLLGGSRYPIGAVKDVPHQRVLDQHLGQHSCGPPVFQVPDGSIAYNAHGQLCQRVNGQILPLPAVNGMLQAYVPVQGSIPFHPYSGGINSPPTFAQLPHVIPAQPSFGQFTFSPMPMHTYSNDFTDTVSPAVELIGIQRSIEHLEHEYGRIDVDRKELEREEVMQSEFSALPLDKSWHDSVIARKMAYVTELDNIRVQIKAFRDKETKLKAVIEDGQVVNQNLTEKGISLPIEHGQPPAWQDHTIPFQQHASAPTGLANSTTIGSQTCPAGLGTVNHMNGVHFVHSPNSMSHLNQLPPSKPLLPMPNQMIHSSPLAPQTNQDLSSPVSPTMANVEHQIVGTTSPHKSVTTLPKCSNNSNVQSPAWSRSKIRRSHAIEIKAPPPEDAKLAAGSRSRLNPASPTYQPNKELANDTQSSGIFVPPSPSPIASPVQHEAVQAQHPWLFKQNSGRDPVPSNRPLKHDTSISSACTEDFFPKDPQEHSLHSFSPVGNVSQVESWPGGVPQITTPHKIKDNDRKGSQSSSNKSAAQASPNDARLSSWNRDCNPIMQRPHVSTRKSSSWASTSVTPNGITALETDAVPSRNYTQRGSVRSPAISNQPVDAAQQSVASRTQHEEGYRIGLTREPVPKDAGPELIRGYIAGLETSTYGKPTRSTQGQVYDQAVRSSPASLRTSSSSHSPHTTPYQYYSTQEKCTKEQNVLRNSVRGNPSVLLASEIRSSQGSQENHPHSIYPGKKVDIHHSTAHTGADMRIVFQNGTYTVNKTVQELEKLGYARTSFSFRQRNSSAIPIAPQSRQPSEHSLQDQASIRSLGSPTVDQIKTHKGRTGSPYSTPPLTKQASNNQVRYVKSTPVVHHRHGPSVKVHKASQEPKSPFCGMTSRSQAQKWVPQVDGAMDDLAEMIEPISLDSPGESSEPAATTSPSKPSKGKEPSSPTKSASSPKKSGMSPTKVRFQQVASKVTRNRAAEIYAKDNTPMSVEEKKKWRENWRKRFRDLKYKEREEIERYNEEHPISPNERA